MSEPPFIDRFAVKNYRCIRACELKLSRLHALVGPNDSGKSTLLAALRVAQRTFAANTAPPPDEPAFEFELGWQDGASVSRSPPGSAPQWQQRGRPITAQYVTAVQTERIGSPRAVRLDPDAMRQPSPLIPSKVGIVFGDERGAGLAGIYDALLARRRRAFDAIEQQLVSLFPQVESLALTSGTASDKQLAAQIKGRKEPVSAPDLSEGMLYFLAFAVLPYVDRTPLVTIEEPENGLHPARIAEIVRVLREVSINMQVVVATHSPLVINELEGNEISVITRDEAGTHATLLSETPNYADRTSVYKNGEIWLSYGDGDQELGLVKGSPSS